MINRKKLAKIFREVVGLSREQDLAHHDVTLSTSCFEGIGIGMSMLEDILN